MMAISLQEQLVAAILAKKELKDFPVSVAFLELEHYLREHPSTEKRLNKGCSPRSSVFRQVAKGVRQRLRRAYGLFRSSHTDYTKERESLSRASGDEFIQLIRQLLQNHPSTRERYLYSSGYQEYHTWWQQLSSLLGITGPPKCILDLGCGLHPLFLGLLPLSLKKVLKYYAYDLSSQELALLQAFFERLHKQQPAFEGRAEVLDIRNLGALRKLPAADICFLLKMTDVLDRGKGHKRTEEVIAAVPAHYVIVSFPTTTMSGRHMNVAKRPWVEWLCRRRGWTFFIISIPTELFYVIRKVPSFLSRIPTLEHSSRKETFI